MAYYVFFVYLANSHEKYECKVVAENLCSAWHSITSEIVDLNCVRAIEFSTFYMI